MIEFSEGVIEKARTYLDAGKVTHYRTRLPKWVVRGSKDYVVMTDADPETRRATWANCSCPHGVNAPVGFPRCSHVVGVLLAVRDGLDLPWYGDGCPEEGCELPPSHPDEHDPLT